MDKLQVDELYHNLREAYLHGDIQEREAIHGIVSHLTQPNSSQGDYTGLLRFLSWYGEKFLLDKVYSAMLTCKLKCERIVDLGAGFGWLGRGLARMGSGALPLPTLFVDKRQWPLIDIVADIEAKNGMQRVLDELKPGDLIVMGELLHCLDNPKRTLKPLSKWPIVALEYYPEYRKEYKDSYDAQIKRLGCVPISDVSGIFTSIGMRCRLIHEQPHVIVVAEPL